MQLEPNEIHIWSADLKTMPDMEGVDVAVLSQDERMRAERLRLPLHQQRFILARSLLRKILSLYLHIPPEAILFAYDDYKKPSLDVTHQSRLHFNLSHSQDIVLYAFTLDHAVGIDIEMMKENYNHGVAKRYFSAQENAQLQQLPEQEKMLGFYRLWSRKEAIIKAVGRGFAIPLSTFSVSTQEDQETIPLEQATWSLLSLPIHPDYQAALASDQAIQRIAYWNFFEQSPKLLKVSQLERF